MLKIEFFRIFIRSQKQLSKTNLEQMYFRFDKFIVNKLKITKTLD